KQPLVRTGIGLFVGTARAHSHVELKRFANSCRSKRVIPQAEPTFLLSRWRAVLIWAFVGSCVPVYGLNPNYTLSQYIHTSWRSDAGLQAVRRLKQTPDGYLWLATRG